MATGTGVEGMRDGVGAGKWHGPGWAGARVLCGWCVAGNPCWMLVDGTVLMGREEAVGRWGVCMVCVGMISYYLNTPSVFRLGL